MNKLKIGDIVMDDEELVYRVLEVFKNSAVVEPFPNQSDFSAEIMSFGAMEREGWKILNKTNYPLNN